MSGMCKSEGIVEDCPGIELNDQSQSFVILVTQ